MLVFPTRNGWPNASGFALLRPCDVVVEIGTVVVFIIILYTFIKRTQMVVLVCELSDDIKQVQKDFGKDFGNKYFSQYCT